MASKRLTTRFVDSIKPPKTDRVEYWDATVTGLGLRVSDSGRKSWVVMYRHQRRLRRLTLGTYPALSLGKAREKAKAALQDAAEGGDPAAAKKAARQADTFREMAEDYMERYAMQRKRSWKEDRRALDRDLLPRFGNRKATDIKRREFIRCFDEIKNRGAPVLANRTLEITRRVYNWAIAQEIVEYNPCQMIEPPAPKVSRERVLSSEEIRTVWAALDSEPLLHAIRFKLMFLTAQRPGEVRHMRWPDIDNESAFWTLSGQFTKNKLAHRVPLAPAAMEMLQEMAELPDRDPESDWVFRSPLRDEPLSTDAKALARIRKVSGVEFWAHDIRRTVATKLTGEIGVTRETVGKILNHVETGVTGTYDRYVYDAEKRQALEAWAQRLEEILAGRSATPANVVTLSDARS